MHLVLAVSSNAAAGPALAGGAGPDIAWWRILGALLLCLLLAAGAALAIRARSGASLPLSWPRRSETQRLRLVERIVLGPQSSLALVALDGREILIAVSPNGSTMLLLDCADLTGANATGPA